MRGLTLPGHTHSPKGNQMTPDPEIRVYEGFEGTYQYFCHLCGYGPMIGDDFVRHLQKAHLIDKSTAWNLLVDAASKFSKRTGC